MEDYPESFTYNDPNGARIDDVLGRSFGVTDSPVDPTGVCHRFRQSIRISPDLVDPPVIGGNFTDAGGTVWTIVSVSKLQFTGGFFVGTINLHINPDTADHINVKTPVFTTDPWADTINTPDPTYQNIPCRIVPIGSYVSMFGDKKGMVRVYDIYILTDLDLDYGSVITSTDPADHKVYIVESMTGRLSLKDFTVIRASVFP